ncbi:MAG: methylenetetrahydrofolate--tRNA-(uracil(54)-C(5))-methyltransferase (FADH(2)-oxidizing) TrmFO [Clostridia bacterium]|nr:methylenetetrahydrofolate--tRNA-(uracil(54)-C(5))-methyltransferase (FADH(2)-oxidizing) TrmFO [Clostridia bacterium]
MYSILVVGGGLAGCEAALRLSRRGYRVTLFEMKPVKFSPAHKSAELAELVCSNSLKALNLESASGLLKEEMRLLGSVCIEAAYSSRVPAGQALAVDRDKFASYVTEVLAKSPGIEIVREEFTDLRLIKEYDAAIIATGPLTSDSLAAGIAGITGDSALSFFDAAAPIIYADSIDADKVYRASRYGKGTDDYINCPMDKNEYDAFYDALISAETAEVHDFDSLKLYEGCMPVESMAARGRDTLKFVPLKPVGLRRPDGTMPYAVVQLRQDNEEGTLYNIVGFQTRLKFSEQKRVFGMIPGLSHAEFARYGVMHRNTYLKSPGILSRAFEFTDTYCGVPLFFAGQMTGVEGYMESAASGIAAAVGAETRLKYGNALYLPDSTMIGALAAYVADFKGKDFQPMGANFGIVNSHDVFEGKRIRDKNLKKRMIAENSLEKLRAFITEHDL